MCVRACGHRSDLAKPLTMDIKRRLCAITTITSLIATSIAGVGGIRLLHLDVPELVEVGSNTVLRCDFDLEGYPLYSVKWYKDDVEFYRYIPDSSVQKITIFNTTGVHLANVTNERVIKLEDVDISTSGVYRCEVSGESPHFQTKNAQKRLSVYILPRDDPIISGHRRHPLKIGQTLNLNCSSAKSRPAANLTWLINDVPVPGKQLVAYKPEPYDERFEKNTLGLKLIVGKDHIKTDPLVVKCIASLESLRSLDHIPENVLNKYSELHLRKQSKDRSLAWATLERSEGASINWLPSSSVIAIVVLILWQNFSSSDICSNMLTT
ncbi:Uncharacterised protein g2128 [Pycnogonum litorale]